MTYRTVLETLIANGKIDGLEAKRVADLYRKLKVLKYNAHDGYQVIHGGFFDYETIRRALAQ